MTVKLHQHKCVPCRRGEPKATDAEIYEYKKEIPDWEIIEVDGVKQLQRKFEFNDFAESLEFNNKIGTIAEEEGHHPKLVTEWGKTTVSWWTHVIKGLHKNDFVMASKTDRLFEKINTAKNE